MTHRQTQERSTDRETYRHKGGHLVYAYWVSEGIELWFNDGPPMTHTMIDQEKLEYLLATGQLLSPTHDGESD